MTACRGTRCRSTCRIAAGRHEDQFYAALGIVCKGPIGAFTAPQMYDANADGIKETFVGSTLDGQMNHGFKTDDNGNTKQPPTYPTENPLLGLRQTLGTDPAGAHDLLFAWDASARLAPAGSSSPATVPG